MGVKYDKGLGVTQNYRVAINWYEKAMQQGSLEAQNNLAECYKYGNGCAKNPRRAFLYFKQISEKGYA